MIKQYTAKELTERLRQADAPILLDVRTAAEFRAGSIRGALHIPLHELGSRSDELRKHAEREIVCFCQSGSRSLSAAAALMKAGFAVANLRGGIAEWNYQQLS